MKIIAINVLFLVLLHLGEGENNVASSLQQHQVVPDVLDAAPDSLLQVKYGDLTVNLGNELTPTQVQQEPSVSWTADATDFYTLCMTDPDAPSRSAPSRREWHHWLVTNIPGDKVGEGDVLTQYVGSGPPKGTGLHRYVFVLYKQPGRINFDETRISNRTGSGRANFSIRRFANKHGLGSPVAANFYQAQWDDYVPTLHGQLSN